MKKDFTIQHTNMLKGVATLLLLFHHLFRQTAYFNFCYTFSDIQVMLMQRIAHHSRVCVALFLFLSGYGLLKSADRFKRDITLRFSILHIFKILSSLWLIFILFVPMGYLFGITLSDTYGSGLIAVWRLFTDFMGLTCRVNKTWWYFRDLFLLYALFPLFYYGVKKNPLLTVIAVSVLTFKYEMEWFLPFVAGIIFAEKNYFSFILQLPKGKRVLFSIMSFCFVLLCFYGRTLYSEYADTFFSIAIICFILSLFSPAQHFGRILVFIGQHSANIYMLHNFIYSKYLRQEIYWFKFPMLIFLMLTIICLILSLGIEKLKKIIKYDRLTNAFQNFILKSKTASEK